MSVDSEATDLDPERYLQQKKRGNKTADSRPVCCFAISILAYYVLLVNRK